MELVAVLRVLWRFRLLVVVAALLATLIGFSMAYRIGFPPKLESRQYHVAIGSTMALVDTPSSQVVDLGGDTGASIQTLAARASLLASLITSSPLKDEIASRAGVAPTKLIAVSPASGPPGSGVNAPEANVLKASIPNLESGEIPIIQVSTQAPDPAVAARLANQAIAVLQAHLASVAGVDKVPDARRMVVRQLGPARFSTQSRGPGRMLAIVAALFVFAFGCATILGVYALVRGWRRAAELELLPQDDEAASYGVPSSREAYDDEDDAFGVPVELPRPVRRANASDESRSSVWGATRS
jgi:hypothetical protein